MGYKYAMTPLLEEALGISIPESHQNASLLCPLHRERNKSFSINLEEGVWICFACGQRGNYESLCRRLGEPIDGDYRIARALRDAAREPIEQRNLTPLANHLHRNALRGRGLEVVKTFLESRQSSLEAIDVFSLGYSEESGAICFPYPDNDGVVRGIKYRFGDGSKSAESGSRFDAFHPELGVGKEKVYVFEGESDTICGWSRLGDHDGVIGTSGAGLSEAQWERMAILFIFARMVILVYDADDAGDRCAEIGLRVLGEKARRGRPTRGKDFSDHVLAGGTVEELRYD
jgi:DNA primase